MIDVAWAQAGGGAAAPGPLVSMLPLVLIGFVFYFLLLRPQQQRAKEVRLMLANLKKNDEVITAGGLYGKVITLADQIVTLEIAPNVRVRVSREQISSVVSAARPEEKDKGKDKEK
jgi:preprotein translocase subunit YajC